MKTEQRIFFAACLLFLTAFYPGLTRALTSESDFLKIPRSARAIALGDSYTAIIGDSTAIEYNPAAMNTIDNFALSFMFQTWIDNTFSCYVSGAIKSYDVVLGASVYYIDYGGFVQYDMFGAPVNEFHPFDLNVKLGASVDGGVFADFLTGLSFGGCVSVIGRSMTGTDSIGLTFDVGLNYTTTFQKMGAQYEHEFFKNPFNIGFAIQNIGFTGNTITPVKGAFGLSLAVDKDFSISADLVVEYGRPLLYKMGFEYTVFSFLILRAGFNVGKETGNLACGVGFRIPQVLNDLRVDYAFSYLGPLGNNHNFSLYADFPVLNDLASYYYQKGIYYYIHGQYKTAKEMWLKSLELDPENKLVQKKLQDVEKLIEIDS